MNVWIDFLLLLFVAIVLKRNYSVLRIFLGSFIGGCSTFFLFFNISSSCLFLLKIFISCLMIIASFSFNNIKNFIESIFYFYVVSIILAGVIYLVKNNYNFNSFGDNFLLLFFVTPIVLFIYYKNVKRVNNYYNKLYKVKLYYNENIYNFVAFLDTGNRLYDQYKRRPIILIYSKNIEFDYAKGLLVPYETANAKTVLKCLRADKIIIDDNIIKYNVIFGLVDSKFNIDEVNMILHSDLIGG